MMNPMLNRMEETYTQSPDTFLNSATTKQNITHCKKALNELEKLIEDMRSLVDSTRWAKKSKLGIKMIVKKSQIQLFQDRIQSALQLLEWSHRIYLKFVLYSFSIVGYFANSHPLDL